MTFLRPTGSVLSFSSDLASRFTQARLLPQKTPQAYFGCASQTGFLAEGEDLLAVAQTDQDVLRRHGVNYQTIAKRLSDLVRSAKLGGAVVDGKFIVASQEPCMGFQYCPFSPEDDSKASGPSTRYDKVCPGTNQDFTITNQQSGASIRFSGLLPHLIGAHHFFLGHVPHRLDPQRVIEVLELPREPEGFIESEPFQETATTLPKNMFWQLAGRHELKNLGMKNSASLVKFFEEVASKYQVDPPQEIVPGLFRLKLPHAYQYYGLSNLSHPDNLTFSHFINVTDTLIRLSQKVDGVQLDGAFPPISTTITCLESK